MTAHFLHAPSGVRHSFVPKKVINYPMAQQAAFLAEAGVPVALHNGQIDGPLSLEDVAKAIAPGDWIVVPLMEGTACAESLDFALGLRRHTGARVVATSYLATLATPEIRETFPAIDALVRGEEELALLDLVTAGSVHRPVIDGAPVDPELWAFPTSSRWGEHFAIQSSRGCAHACTFCSANSMGNPAGRPHWRALRSATVVSWLERAYELGCRMMEFVDADFLGTTAEGLVRGHEIADANPIGVSIMAATRADTIVRHVRLIERLRDVGFVKWQVGIESADPDTLKRYRKGMTLSTSMRAIELLDALGLSMRLEFIMFEPGTTLTTLRANLDLLGELAERGIRIQRALFNRLRVGRWSSEIFGTLARERRLVRHIFPLYDYVDVDPTVAAIWRAVQAGHSRETGLAFTLSLLLERLLDAGSLDVSPSRVRSHVLALDRILLSFVDAVVRGEGHVEDPRVEAAAGELKSALRTWLELARPLADDPAVERAYPGARRWIHQSLGPATQAEECHTTR